MKRLEKIIKIAVISFIVCLIFLGIAMWQDIEWGQKFTNIFMIIFLLILCTVLAIALILSINSILKYIKKDPLGFLKSFILRFIILLAIDLGIDYITGKRLDIVYSLAYSLALTIGSFYIEDKFL